MCAVKRARCGSACQSNTCKLNQCGNKHTRFLPLFFALAQRQGNTSSTGSQARSLPVTRFDFPPKAQTYAADRWIGLWKLCQRCTASMAMIHSHHWQIRFPPSRTHVSNKPSNKHIPLLLQLACSPELTRPAVTAGCGNWTNTLGPTHNVAVREK